MVRKYREAMIERLRADPAFRAALLREAAQNLAAGEVEIALEQILDVPRGRICHSSGSPP